MLLNTWNLKYLCLHEPCVTGMVLKRCGTEAFLGAGRREGSGAVEQAELQQVGSLACSVCWHYLGSKCSWWLCGCVRMGGDVGKGKRIKFRNLKSQLCSAYLS